MYKTQAHKVCRVVLALNHMPWPGDSLQKDTENRHRFLYWELLSHWQMWIHEISASLIMNSHHKLLFGFIFEYISQFLMIGSICCIIHIFIVGLGEKPLKLFLVTCSHYRGKPPRSGIDFFFTFTDYKIMWTKRYIPFPSQISCIYGTYHVQYTAIYVTMCRKHLFICVLC